MPLHINLEAPIAVGTHEPPEEGSNPNGKELIIPVIDAGQVFHYKMTAELAAEIAKQLMMTTEELEEYQNEQIKKQRTAAALDLPPGIDISAILGNGKGQG